MQRISRLFIFIDYTAEMSCSQKLAVQTVAHTYLRYIFLLYLRYIFLTDTVPIVHMGKCLARNRHTFDIYRLLFFDS